MTKCESILKERKKQEEFWEKILEWGENNLREFPWRKTEKKYRILIAEIMLHRTQATQVEDIYASFIGRYPDFNAIFEAGKEKIRNDLRSLGLLWRADLLYSMAEEIVKNYGGEVPLEKDELLKLPGVGNYIASALLCFASNRPEPLLDTNTVRVIGRVYGMEITDSSRRSKEFEQILWDMAELGDARKFYLSLIDFAATICKAANPRCDDCPLKKICCSEEV